MLFIVIAYIAGYIKGKQMKKKTMSFVRRRKWIRAHRLIGLTLSPTPIVANAKNSSRKKSPRKENEKNEEGKGIEKNRGQGLHDQMDHVVDDVDDEQDEDENENGNSDENDDDEDGDDLENSTKTDDIPNSFYHPDDPILGAKNQNPGVNRADTRQFRLQVNILYHF